MHKPFISIIIPFYNSIETIDWSVQSVLDQKYDDYEILIVDDGSTDERSIQWLENANFKNCNLYRLPHSGPCTARNFGIEKAKGEFILFLDSDDLIAKNTLKTVSDILLSEQSDWLLGNCEIIGKTKRLRQQETPSQETQLIYNQIPICNYIRKSILLEAGLFDEKMNLLGLEDWELWIRVLALKPTIQLHPEVLFTIYERENSRTTEEAEKNKNEIIQYVLSKHADLYHFTLEETFYRLKMTLETPDYRTGNLFLKPYRFIKKLLVGKK